MRTAGLDQNYIEDMEQICHAQFIPWGDLCGKTVLVTGATGLIGHTLVNALLYANKEKGLGLTVLALVRNVERAKKRFAHWNGIPAGTLRFLEGSIEKLPDIAGPIDYIIHGASQTASRAFVEQPVETIDTAIEGTSNLLRVAKEKKVLGFTFLSSMEVYGHPQKGHKVTEEEIGALSPLNLRNSYSISKQMCESLCCAYAAEYQVPANIVRLTQTFGPGVQYHDGRIFADLARCILEKRDIVLKTKGETERSYLYTADAAAAILTVLLKGEAGQAYNAADESTYCSIAEMARHVAQMGRVGVRFQLEDERKNGYASVLYMNLDTKLLKTLGWNILQDDMESRGGVFCQGAYGADV